MLVGHKDNFAFEYELEPIEDYRFLVKFLMWARNNAIGNFNDPILSGVIFGQLQSSVAHAAERQDSALFAADKASAFEKLHYASYGCHDLSAEKMMALMTRYQWFNLSDIGDSSFDHLFVFLVSDGDKGERLLWRPRDGGTIMEAWLPSGAYESAATALLHALDKATRK